MGHELASSHDPSLSLTVAAVTGFTPQASAQSSQDDLSLARSLRAAFAPDLAAELLEKPATPPAGSWKGVIAIERARALRECATKVASSYAAMLIETAQREIESSLHEAGNKPLELLLRFELARLAAADGRFQLAWQGRAGVKPTLAESKKVREKLSKAASLLEACVAPAASENAILLAADEGDFAPAEISNEAAVLSIWRQPVRYRTTPPNGSRHPAGNAHSMGWLVKTRTIRFPGKLLPGSTAVTWRTTTPIGPQRL